MKLVLLETQHAQLDNDTNESETCCRKSSVYSAFPTATSTSWCDAFAHRWTVWWQASETTSFPWWHVVLHIGLYCNFSIR